MPRRKRRRREFGADEHPLPIERVKPMAVGFIACGRPADYEVVSAMIKYSLFPISSLVVSGVGECDEHVARYARENDIPLLTLYCRPGYESDIVYMVKGLIVLKYKTDVVSDVCRNIEFAARRMGKHVYSMFIDPYLVE